MPLQTFAATAPHRARLARGAIIAAAACLAAGSAGVADRDDHTALASRSTDVPTGRYHDIEANKANSMRALGLAASQLRSTADGHDGGADKDTPRLAGSPEGGALPAYATTNV